MNALTFKRRVTDQGQGRCQLLATVAVAAACALLTATAPAAAGVNGLRPGAASQADQARAVAGAPVLPPQAQPYGYSLTAMARLLAAFNVGDRTAPPPNSPFQVLYLNTVTGATSFTVAPGTMLYVPLLYNDNSVPLVGHFPANVDDRAKVLQYWYSQSEFGVTTMQLVVDGKVIPLGAGYVSGVSFASPLGDGATQYLTAGAFIAPLPRGDHVVEIRFKATGDALRQPPIDQYFPDGYWEFSISYAVRVR